MSNRLFAYQYKTETRAKFVHGPKPGGSDTGRTLPALSETGRVLTLLLIVKCQRELSVLSFL